MPYGLDDLGEIAKLGPGPSTVKWNDDDDGNRSVLVVSSISEDRYLLTVSAEITDDHGEKMALSTTGHCCRREEAENATVRITDDVHGIRAEVVDERTGLMIGDQSFGDAVPVGAPDPGPPTEEAQRPKDPGPPHDLMLKAAPGAWVAIPPS